MRENGVPSLLVSCSNVAENGRFRSDEIMRTLAAIMSEEGLLRAMLEVGYFPPNNSSPVTIAGS